jgi:hypothetical protein
MTINLTKLNSLVGQDYADGDTSGVIKSVELTGLNGDRAWATLDNEKFVNVTAFVRERADQR